MKLSDYKNILSGELISDGKFETLEYCTSLCDRKYLTFIEDEKYIERMNENIECVITKREFKEKLLSHVSGVFVSDEPKKEFVILHNFLSKKESYFGKSFDTKIGANCEISQLASISDKNVCIGSNVQIAPFVVIRENVYIGDNCKIYENSVIGGKSFNYVKLNNGQMLGMKDCGKVILEEGVEVFSNCHIAGCPLPTDITKLGKDVKLDAYVHVGHGTRIGEGTLIPAGAQIAGNVTIGKNAWIGVNATIANRITIEDNARVSLGAVVTKRVFSESTVTGNFAIPHDKFINNLKESIRIKNENNLEQMKLGG